MSVATSGGCAHQHEGLPEFQLVEDGLCVVDMASNIQFRRSSNFKALDSIWPKIL